MKEKNIRCHRDLNRKTLNYKTRRYPLGHKFNRLVSGKTTSMNKHDHVSDVTRHDRQMAYWTIIVDGSVAAKLQNRLDGSVASAFKII